MLCYKCGLRNFQELAYQFRRDIPRDELPGVLDVSFICLLLIKSADRGDYSGLFAVRWCKGWEKSALARAVMFGVLLSQCHSLNIFRKLAGNLIAVLGRDYLVLKK